MKNKVICFNVEIDDDFEEELKKIVAHHIEQLLDMNSFPEIKAINSAEIIDGNSSYSAVDMIAQEKQKRGMKEDIEAYYRDAPEECKRRTVEYLIDHNHFDYTESYWDNLSTAMDEEIANGPEDITSDKIREFIPVQKNFSYVTERPYTDEELAKINKTPESDNLGMLYDIVSLEIIPEGIPKLEKFLERKNPRIVYTERDLKELNDPENDAYERIVLYVYVSHFELDQPRLSLSRWTPHDIRAISPDLVLTKKEKENIIEIAKDYIRQA